MELTEILCMLDSAHGPSGDEGDIRAVIQQLARPWADEITADVMGNLVARKKGSGPKVMFAAHMDSIGFIVTHIEKEGFLRVGKLGGISPKDVLNTPVRFKNGVRGVLVAEEKAEDKLKLEDCYLDIGARDEAQARSRVQVGDTVVYDTAVTETNGRVLSPYLDDRIACAILLKTLELVGDCENDLYFVFTAQEEVGLRGAGAAAFAVEPDVAIAVDVTDTGDLPEMKTAMAVEMGGGPAVKVMDRSVICSPAVCAGLEKAAELLGISTQREILQCGGTDTAALQKARAGVAAGAVSIPTRYIHSPSEMCAVSDVEQSAALLAKFAVL